MAKITIKDMQEEGNFLSVGCYVATNNISLENKQSDISDTLVEIRMFDHKCNEIGDMFLSRTQAIELAMAILKNANT